MRNTVAAVLAVLAVVAGCSALAGGNPDTTPAPAASTPLPEPTPVEPVLTLVVPEGPTDCPATPADYDDWALATGQILVGIGGGVGPMILGGTVTVEGTQWQVMGSDLHQQFIFAAPLPLAVGGDLVYLGGTSLRDGSWMWASGVGQEWRTTLAQDTMTAAGHVVACMKIAYEV